MFKITCTHSDCVSKTYVLNKGQSEDVYSAAFWLKENGKWGVEITKHTPAGKGIHNDCSYVDGGYCSYYTVQRGEHDGKPDYLAAAKLFASVLPERKSYACYFNTTQDYSDGSYNTNGLRFATIAEAVEYAKQLEWRWMAVKAWVIVPTDDPVSLSLP